MVFDKSLVSEKLYIYVPTDLTFKHVITENEITYLTHINRKEFLNIRN